MRLGLWLLPAVLLSTSAIAGPPRAISPTLLGVTAAQLAGCAKVDPSPGGVVLNDPRFEKVMGARE